MQIEIKPKTIVIAFLIFIGLEFFINIYPILLLILLSYIIACTLEPVVDYLVSKGINYSSSIIIVYLTLFLLIIALYFIGTSSSVT